MKIDYDEIRKIIIYNTLWLQKHYELSRESMAEVMCVDVQTITELEKGNLTDNFTVETLFKMQNYFNVNMKVLIGKYLE